MICPKCKVDDVYCIDSRLYPTYRRRRYQCFSCEYRFSTKELFSENIEVSKADVMKFITEAIEKTTPAKPKADRQSKDVLVFCCSCCGNKIISKIKNEWCAGKMQNYCDSCGQALNWEGLS